MRCNDIDTTLLNAAPINLHVSVYTSQQDLHDSVWCWRNNVYNISKYVRCIFLAMTFLQRDIYIGNRQID